jgi:LysR family transcriptional regulator, transcriptional activator of the cysJI operon
MLLCLLMDDRLQKFARLAEIGNFTKASKILHISQPALSIAIDKLEQELGSELIIRGSRKFELTEAGEAAYAAALEHQNITDHLRTALISINKQRPTVTLGMTDSVAAILCESVAFDDLERAADVTIIVNNSRYLREAVIQRRIDVAFVVDDGAEHSSLITKPSGVEELVLVSHPALVMQARADIAKGKLDNFICYDKPSTTYRHIHRALQTYGIKPHMTLFSTSPDVMLSMVLRGKGTGALPHLLVKDLVRAGTLAHPDSPKARIIIKRPVCSVRLTGKSLPACLKQFMASAHIAG